jgi:hypothetical protein
VIDEGDLEYSTLMCGLVNTASPLDVAPAGRAFGPALRDAARRHIPRT